MEDYNFRRNYRIAKFPDEVFTELLRESLKVSGIDMKFRVMKKLVEHALDKMGRFNVDGWKVRTELEID